MMTHAYQMHQSPYRHITPGEPAPVAMIHVVRGDTIFLAGKPGHAWRLSEGCVRLDRKTYHEASWAGLAIAGDIIGMETLIDSLYTYTASAVTSCTLCAWAPPAPSMTDGRLTHALIRSEQRMAETLALRVGRAQDRIHRFLHLLGCAPLELPKLQDIADITGLTLATVSRTLTAMSLAGILRLEGRQRAQRITHIQRPMIN